MVHKLSVREEAREKIFESFFWYEKKKEGLGTRFIVEMDAMLDYIKHYPHHFQIKYKNFREAILRAFPYIVVYRIIENEIIVYTVFPTKDNPDKKP